MSNKRITGITMLRTVALAAFAALASLAIAPTAVLADRAPRPKRKVDKKLPPITKKLPPITAKLDVTFSRKARRAEVRLPHAVFAALHARDQLRKKRAWLAPEGRTMIAGVALAIGLAFTGLWLARDRRRRWAVGPLLIVLGVGTLLLFSGLAHSKKVQQVGYADKKIELSVTRGRAVLLDVDGAKVCENVY